MFYTICMSLILIVGICLVVAAVTGRGLTVNDYQSFYSRTLIVLMGFGAVALALHGLTNNGG